MCTLRVYGKHFDVDGFLKKCPWPVAGVYRRGAKRGRRVVKNSGFNVGVSDASWADLTAQTLDATIFIKKNKRALMRLSRNPNVDGVVLDFPVESRLSRHDSWSQEEHFPGTFIQLVGSLGIGIALSIYPVARKSRIRGSDH